ncbi:hypothetical protein F0562_032082 [Nyssa sinensis]|uniref:FAF domain-containing protein n=1 Tax=Nyssa sinensis TaxID=561372 RepID=A0A5J5ATW0_9ASTE|nr:hypothetical protein F0562_032082 [Nyssa sinensis]
MESLYSQKNTKTEKPYEDPCVTEMFGELYFKENHSSSLQSLPPPLMPLPILSSSSSAPLPNSTPQTTTKKLNGDTNHEKEKSTKNKCMYTKSLQTSKERLFPPPISFLKLFKTGKPFVYLKLDENTGDFVHEEIRIPPLDVLCTLRENGLLKLNFAHDYEAEDEQEGGHACDGCIEVNQLALLLTRSKEFRRNKDLETTWDSKLEFIKAKCERVRKELKLAKIESTSARNDMAEFKERIKKNLEAIKEEAH